LVTPSTFLPCKPLYRPINAHANKRKWLHARSELR
jgi:hypothetical protein